MSGYGITGMGTQRSISGVSRTLLSLSLRARYLLTTLEGRVNYLRASVRVEMSR